MINIYKNLHKIPTPCYVCEYDKLKKNLKTLRQIEKKSGAKILLALKGFAFSEFGRLVGKNLSGVTCSGLHEAMFGDEFFKKEIHTYSPAYKSGDLKKIFELSDHVVFNSFSQLKTHEKKIKKAVQNGKKIGLRINPQTSNAPVEMYDPCGKFSRFGVRSDSLLHVDDERLLHVSGFHLHALCESGADALLHVVNVLKRDFSELLRRAQWLNLGGGHLITAPNYDKNLLIQIIKDLKDEFDLDVYLEPGEAVGLGVGVLVASVLDIVKNEKQIAILDTSAEAHMPDVLAMPYRPSVVGGYKEGVRPHSYRLAGNTCLAGDVIGDYSFNRPLCVGDKIIFEDMIHYSIVKNTTFNGIKLPDLGVIDKYGDFRITKKFGYEEYRRRN